MRANRITSVDTALELARRRIPRGIMQSLENGAGNWDTVEANVDALRQVKFRPGGGMPASERQLGTHVLGADIGMPVIAASIGQLGAAHPEGEMGVARAFGAVDSIQFVSGFTSQPIEEIVAAASGPVYYQLYYFGGDRRGISAIVERARDAGCAGLVLCIDSAAAQTPVRNLSLRDRAFAPTAVDFHDAIRFAPQLLTKPGWTMDFLRGRVGRHGAMALDERGAPLPFAEAQKLLHVAVPSWDDLPWLREIWDCPVIIKGALSLRDARRAVEVGAAGLVVSNHGGNRLDGTMPSLWALPAIVDEVGERIDVLFDSGIRTGADVLKALALGAKAVLLGRAYLYPLAAAGEAGVTRILEILSKEMTDGLALLGCTSVDELGRDHVVYPAEWHDRAGR